MFGSSAVSNRLGYLFTASGDGSINVLLCIVGLQLESQVVFCRFGPEVLARLT